MSDLEEEAKEWLAAKRAILQGIARAAENGRQPRTVEHLALAYRYLEGGPQPGNTVLDKSS